MVLRRSALACAGAALAGAALTLAGGPAMTVHAPAHHTPAGYHRPSAAFLSQARRALAGYLAHTHPQAMLAHATTARSGNVTASGSYNWSGYADDSTTDGTFTKVSGSWTTPSVRCSKEDTITSEWVGLDGWSDTTVEQDGTISWCYKDTPTYFTWYEMYPAGTVEVGRALKPGDAITASVTRSGTTYTLKVTDSTHSANSFTQSATCAAATCLATSAEWISERSSFAIGIAPLADYHSWRLANATTTAAGKSGSISAFTGGTVNEVTMVDATDAYHLATTGKLSSGGSRFEMAWRNSY